MKTILKKDIYRSLESLKVETGKSIVETGFVKNIVIFDEQVVIDLQHTNPTLQSKKKIEKEILQIIHKDFGKQIDIKLNFTTNPVPPNNIKADKKLQGIDSVIAIASGKGGVGKSTITANLAVSLVNMGFKVGILDADIYGPSIHIMFDATHEKPQSVTIGGKSMIQPVERYGVKLLSLGFFTGINQAVIWRGPMASKALNQLIFDANWGKLDFLLLDLPPGTGDVHLSMVQALPITGALVVSTPQQIAIADARKGITMFEQELIKVPVLGLIENMSYFTPKELPENKYYIFGKDGVKNLCDDGGIPLLGEIPLIQGVREAADVGRPVTLQKNTPIVDVFDALTKKMLSQLVIRNKEMPPTQKVKITTMSGCAT